jgi:CubicO group peptidase (beta-lactamase class C family)
VRTISSVFLLCACALAQSAVYPGRHWQTADPASLGWSVPKIEEARSYLATLPPATVLVVDRGRLVVQWGDPAMRVKISSVRKSFLSALYGIYAQEGRIDLNKTLAELAIDDQPPLTEVERKATVRMLLQSRSGIYHAYVAGTPGMRATTPAPRQPPLGLVLVLQQLGLQRAWHSIRKAGRNRNRRGPPRPHRPTDRHGRLSRRGSLLSVLSAGRP